MRYNEMTLYEWLKQHSIYNGEVGALTESEASLIYNARSLNTATERLTQAREEAVAASQPELFPRRSRQEEIEVLSAHRTAITPERQAIREILRNADRGEQEMGRHQDNEHER